MSTNFNIPLSTRNVATEEHDMSRQVSVNI